MDRPRPVPAAAGGRRAGGNDPQQPPVLGVHLAVGACPRRRAGRTGGRRRDHAGPAAEGGRLLAVPADRRGAVVGGQVRRHLGRGAGRVRPPAGGGDGAELPGRRGRPRLPDLPAVLLDGRVQPGVPGRVPDRPTRPRGRAGAGRPPVGLRGAGRVPAAAVDERGQSRRCWLPGRRARARGMAPVASRASIRERHARPVRRRRDGRPCSRPPQVAGRVGPEVALRAPRHRPAVAVRLGRVPARHEPAGAAAGGAAGRRVGAERRAVGRSRVPAHESRLAVRQAGGAGQPIAEPVSVYRGQPDGSCARPPGDRYR